jgi:hypothetical protein
MMNDITGSHRDPRQHRRRAGVLAAALTMTVALAGACGGSGSASPAGSSSSHPAGYRQYHAYSQCMRSHGAPFWPEPSEVSAGVFDNPNTYVITARILVQEHGPGWQAALTACQHLAPPQLPFTAAQISALRSELLKLAACMRTHGITHFPSPVAGPSGGGFPSPGPGVSPDSGQFRAAQRACWAYAPGA